MHASSRSLPLQWHVLRTGAEPAGRAGQSEVCMSGICSDRCRFLGATDASATMYASVHSGVLPSRGCAPLNVLMLHLTAASGKRNEKAAASSDCTRENFVHLCDVQGSGNALRSLLVTWLTRKSNELGALCKGGSTSCIEDPTMDYWTDAGKTASSIMTSNPVKGVV